MFNMNKTLPIVHIELKKTQSRSRLAVPKSCDDGSGERHVDQGLFDLKIIHGYM